MGVSILDYGGNGNDSVDNLAAFNAANAYLSSVGGGTIGVPSGIYRVSDTIELSPGVSIDGDKGVIKTTSPTANVIEPSNNNSITGCKFTSSVPRAGGAAVYLNGAYEVKIEDNIFSDFLYTIKTGPLGGVLVWIEDNIIFAKQDPTAVGIYLTGKVNEYWISHNFIRGGVDFVIPTIQPLAGILFEDCSGIYTDHNSLLFAGNGFYFNPGADGTVSWVFSDGDIIDTGAYGVLSVGAAGGMVKGVVMSNGWLASMKNHGAVLFNGAGIDGFSFENMTAVNNAGNGFFLSNGKNVAIRNSMTAGNSVKAPNTASGIYVAGTLTHLALQDNRAGQALGLPNTQKYGIELGFVSTDYYMITGNNASINMTGSILDHALGLHKVVANNF